MKFNYDFFAVCIMHTFFNLNIVLFAVTFSPKYFQFLFIKDNLIFLHCCTEDFFFFYYIIHSFQNLRCQTGDNSSLHVDNTMFMLVKPIKISIPSTSLLHMSLSKLSQSTRVLRIQGWIFSRASFPNSFKFADTCG